MEYCNGTESQTFKTDLNLEITIDQLYHPSFLSLFPSYLSYPILFHPILTPSYPFPPISLLTFLPLPCSLLPFYTVSYQMPIIC